MGVDCKGHIPHLREHTVPQISITPKNRCSMLLMTYNVITIVENFFPYLSQCYENVWGFRIYLGWSS